MSLIATKIALTPTLMWAVSAAARRWGNLVGGLLSGLPLTSAPISIYFAAEQGEVFAADAAAASIEGIGAITLCNLAYVASVRRFGLRASLFTSGCAFLLGGVLMHLVLRPGVFAAAAIDLALAVAVLALCPAPAAPDQRAVPPRWDMPARLLAATALVVLTSALAPLLGPGLSGIVAPIPIISWPLIVFTHVHEGAGQALGAVRGTVQGSLGVLAFYLCLHQTIGATGAVVAYALAIALSVAFVVPWLFVRR